MKLTQAKKVMDIVRPPFVGISQTPAVDLSVSLVDAVEQMIAHDLSVIAVNSNGRLVGHMRLADALRHLGLPYPDNFPGDRPTK